MKQRSPGVANAGHGKAQVKMNPARYISSSTSFAADQLALSPDTGTNGPSTTLRAGASSSPSRLANLFDDLAAPLALTLCAWSHWLDPAIANGTALVHFTAKAPMLAALRLKTMPAGLSTALRQAARHPHPRPATVDPGPRIGLADEGARAFTLLIEQPTPP